MNSISQPGAGRNSVASSHLHGVPLLLLLGQLTANKLASTFNPRLTQGGGSHHCLSRLSKAETRCLQASTTPLPRVAQGPGGWENFSSNQSQALEPKLGKCKAQITSSYLPRAPRQSGVEPGNPPPPTYNHHTIPAQSLMLVNMLRGGANPNPHWFTVVHFYFPLNPFIMLV